jgi:hypothetical protein
VAGHSTHLAGPLYLLPIVKHSAKSDYAATRLTAKLPLLYLLSSMLSQDEFTALLQRYLAGQHTVAEHHLLAQWMIQVAEPGQSELTAEESAQVRAAMWQRIEEAMQENQ